MPKTSKIRVYVENELICGSEIVPNAELTHYLLTVMRLQSGERILAFDGHNGEFEAELATIGKKSAILKIISKTRNFYQVPDIRLLFAPLKKDCTDFVVEKATELGVAAIVPVITDYTISEKVKIERWHAQAIEAAEQCRRVDIPQIAEAITLDKLLADWDKNRTLYFMDETGNGRPAAEIFRDAPAPADFLIGPEGGFSERELTLLRSQPYARAVNLGPRILRAETAAITALACWQSLSGDWK